MEVSEVRKRVNEVMDRAKRQSAERRAAADRMGRDFETFLTVRAIPLVRQIANVLKAESYSFSVATPAGGVRLMSDKSGEDYIDISLDTSTDPPRVVGRTSRTRGRRSVDAERVVASGDPAAISEEELLEFLMKELEPFVER